ncbi:unnamed protein product [Rotaria socialis]|uniref:Diacylglycerol O-acyltransferase n=1 Tax=Rotaria socialis TaxID=392032 RepID=A0A821FHG6_9BILA|nr:unnamed protein product [Rotaria socialis]CAF4650996.1 unnamed protein product [Rotaria socialis]
MQADSRWAKTIVSNLASVSFDINNRISHIKRQLSTAIIRYPYLPLLKPTLKTANLFPIQQVDMPRSQQTQDRKRTGYIRSGPTDELQINNTCMQNITIKHVKHPTEQSSVVVFLKRLSSFCFGLFISIPCVILITLFLPISWLIRAFTRFTCRYHCTVTPCTCSYLSSTDLFWFYNSNISRIRNKDEETTKLNSQTSDPMAAAIFFLEGPVNENSLKKILMNRLITNNFRRGSNVGRKLFPRFSQLIYSHFSGTMWIDYAAFSIDEHVREIPRNIQTDEDLQTYISALMSAELSFTRPLWQLHYKNRSSLHPSDSILLFLYHPVLSDGISLIRILLKHIVDNRTTQLDLKPRFAGRRSEHIFDYIKAYFFGHTLLFNKLIFNSYRDNILKRILYKNNNINTTDTTNLHLSTQQQRLVVWSTPFSLTQASRMKLVTRTRMNDLLSTLVISCVKLYMEKHNLPYSSNINCVIPCDLRSNSPNIAMGNRIAHLSLELPMNVEGNIPLLWSFNDNTKRVKRNGDYATMYLFTHLTYFLFPLCIANRIMARIYDNASLWLTTLATGSSTTLATMSICNRDVRSVICLNPSISTHSINFCVTSYADEIRLTVIVDPNLIPDAQFFTKCFNEQLYVIQELLAHRRIPGEIRRMTRPPRFPLPKRSISSASDMSDDLSIEEIQAKMATLQQELLSLKSQFENLDMNDSSSQNDRLLITTKLEELRREFRELLIKLQERQCELSGMIPSDEEDEMDPHVRVRLRSASVASRISLKSNEQRPMSGRLFQFDKDDGSEYSASVVHCAAPNSISSSKISFQEQQQQTNDQQQAGMRRAQSVSICENTRVVMQRQSSLNRARPTPPARTFTTATTNATVVHFNSSENCKN